MKNKLLHNSLSLSGKGTRTHTHTEISIYSLTDTQHTLSNTHQCSPKYTNTHWCMSNWHDSSTHPCLFNRPATTLQHSLYSHTHTPPISIFNTHHPTPTYRDTHHPTPTYRDTHHPTPTFWHYLGSTIPVNPLTNLQMTNKPVWTYKNMLERNFPRSTHGYKTHKSGVLCWISSVFV